MRRAAIGLAILTLTLTGAPEAESQSGGLVERARKALRSVDANARPGQRAPQGTGVIQYDDGNPDGVRTCDFGFTFLGNLFDTQNGSPLSTGTIYAMSWYNGPVVATYGHAFGLFNSPGATSPISINVGVPVESAFNTATFTPQSVIPPFFLGMNAPYVIPAAPEGIAPGRIGFTVAAPPLGPGFHASQRTFSGAGSAITTQNIVLRVVGNIWIPVELMEFEVD